MSAKSRPVFLEIPNIRLPIPGIVSILHRISGVERWIAKRRLKHIVLLSPIRL